MPSPKHLLAPTLIAALALSSCTSPDDTTTPPTSNPTPTVTTPTIPPALPDGSDTVLPGHRLIALYGHPSGPALGVLGEHDPQGSIDYLNGLVEQYQALSDTPVVPAFEIIATVASDSPGPDGNYVNETAPDDLINDIDAITAAGGYAILDIQPGRSTPLELATQYTDLLLRPNVGLAIDPEWALGPEDQPGDNVGHVTAAEINDVSNWLQQLTVEHNLPQKLLVLHQFQLQMIRNREDITLDNDRVATVIHVDGHGPREDKMFTWETMRKDLDPRIFLAWKNFIDEDTPTFTPEETMQVEPAPVFISYQ